MEIRNSKGKIIIVGDLHGCLKEATLLLERCEASVDDKVILLGDLVDRGPDSAGCVDLAMRLENRQGAPASILGNHEEKHLFYQDLERKNGHVNVQAPTHVATRQQLRPEHYDYFRKMPKYIRLPDYNAVCVHAGMYPNRQVEKQSDKHLLHCQAINPYDKWGNPTYNEKSVWPSKVPEGETGWKFWTEFWKGPERVIFGHSVLNEPMFTDTVVGLDGGCCFGLELWALVLPEWKIVKQKSLHPVVSRGRQLIQINDKIGTYS